MEKSYIDCSGKSDLEGFGMVLVVTGLKMARAISLRSKRKRQRVWQKGGQKWIFRISLRVYRLGKNI